VGFEPSRASIVGESDEDILCTVKSCVLCAKEIRLVDREVMPRTRAVVDRITLEQATHEQLKKEARRYKLPSTGDRATLIDAIMSHLERHGQTDLPTEHPDEASGEAHGETRVPMQQEPLTANTFKEGLVDLQQKLIQSQMEMQ